MEKERVSYFPEERLLRHLKQLCSDRLTAFPVKTFISPTFDSIFLAASADCSLSVRSLRFALLESDEKWTVFSSAFAFIRMKSRAWAKGRVPQFKNTFSPFTRGFFFLIFFFLSKWFIDFDRLPTSTCTMFRVLLSRWPNIDRTISNVAKVLWQGISEDIQGGVGCEVRRRVCG